MSDPNPPAVDPAQKRRKLNAWILGVAVLLVTLVAVVGCGDDEDSAAAPSTTSAAATPNEPATTAPSTTGAVGGQPFGPSDPRCEAAAQPVVDSVAVGLSNAGYELRNGTVITSGGLTYFGASIFGTDGQMEERSDVWVIQGGTVYASTGGARNNTTFPKASAAPLNISPGDEIVQAVDTCVVNLTTGG
ncbi:DUF2510 domain-containing protein [Nocardia uniformis]|uniref:DUF2510 domain-containing protein n=1 Tax=Nocardia uniformis TaxID=53432 RepID=A0A849CD69_9NOCA|nr:DUF2510 domain-containing protein [Nocardia uniformis]NNH74335.1 DUF2510 domain-containing protein [Nocardia uniformis]